MKPSQKNYASEYYPLGSVSSPSPVPAPTAVYGNYLLNLPIGHVTVLLLELSELNRFCDYFAYSSIKYHHWIIYDKNYLTLGVPYPFDGYSLGWAIIAIEEFMGIKIIKEKHVHEYLPDIYSLERFHAKEKNGEIKALYKGHYSPGHICYNIEDVKKCLPECIICRQKMTKIHWQMCCSEKCTEQYIINENRKVKKWLKQKRSQKQFRKCRKLMGKSRRALRKEDLNACKLLSEEFKQVAISL